MNNTHKNQACSCFYGAHGYNGRFYVLCASCPDFHSPTDQRTGKYLAFDRRVDATRLANRLNKTGVHVA